MDAPSPLVLTEARLPDGRLADVRIDDGHVSEIVPHVRDDGDEAARIPLAGRLLVPAFVDGHVHLDKTLLGAPWLDRFSGGAVAERIEIERSVLRTSNVPVAERAMTLVRRLATTGTGHARSHVDIDPEVGLSGLEALVDVRERCREFLDLQLVAFPQSGILRRRGVADLLDAALREGADVIGGLDPAGLDGDVDGHLDVVFGLAERHGVAIDIHLHDPGSNGAWQLRRIAERTRALGLQGRVTVGHAFALGMVDRDELTRTARALADAAVSIMTTGPTGAMPPVLTLREEGVRVFAASDNIRDAWSPYGTGDVLERATTVAYQSGFVTDAELGVAFEMITSVPAMALEIVDYGIAVGSTADVVAIDATTVAEAVAGHPRRHLVLHHGQVVALDDSTPAEELLRLSLAGAADDRAAAA